MNFFKKLFGSKSSERSDIEVDNSDSISVDLNTAMMIEALTKTISYNGGNVEQFYEEMSGDLIKRHGKLVEVDYISHFPDFEIYFAYEDGMRIYSGRRTGHYNIHFLSLGYVGEGPRYAKHFLAAAGYDLSYDQSEAIVPGDSIKLENGVAIIQKKADKVNEKDLGAVKFLRERNEIVMGSSATYRHYSAPDKISAMFFLDRQNITAQAYLVVVETPEGVFAKDRMGVFEQ